MEDSVYFSKCFMSPSCCLPKHEEYRRLPVPAVYGGESGGRSNRSRWLWRKMLRKVLSNKRIYRSIANNKRPAALTFQYDAVSYSQNFDDGRNDEDHCHRFRRFSPVFQDHVR
uniref:Uncharacterized protein n=1 Tax=Opuntia streptacantha TaxID=393608 RepID=A0A7C9DE44_OPUST